MKNAELLNKVKKIEAVKNGVARNIEFDDSWNWKQFKESFLEKYIDDYNGMDKVPFNFYFKDGTQSIVRLFLRKQISNMNQQIQQPMQSNNQNNLFTLITENANLKARLSIYEDKVETHKETIAELKLENKELKIKLTALEKKVNEATGGFDLSEILDVVKMLKGNGSNSSDGLLNQLNKLQSEGK